MWIFSQRGAVRANSKVQFLKNKLGDSVNILKVDVDQNQELSQQYGIRSVPTLILFKDGEAVWRGYGLHQADMLEEKLREHIPDKSDE